MMYCFAIANRLPAIFFISNCLRIVADVVVRVLRFMARAWLQIDISNFKILASDISRVAISTLKLLPFTHSFLIFCYLKMCLISKKTCASNALRLHIWRSRPTSVWRFQLQNLSKFEISTLEISHHDFNFRDYALHEIALSS
jgi:hypothetical protein